MNSAEVSAATVCVCSGFNLELALSAWVQRFLVEELEVAFVPV